MKNKFGYTLVELSIAVAVLAVLAGVFAPVISQGIDAMLAIKDKEVLLNEASLAMQWMSNELRTDFEAFNSFNSTIIWFQSHADPTHLIGYRIQTKTDSRGVAHQDLIRVIFDMSTMQEIPTTNPPTLARDVTFFELRYYPALTGTRIPRYSEAPGPGAVAVVQIRLILTSPASGDSVELLTRIRQGHN